MRSHGRRNAQSHRRHRSRKLRSFITGTPIILMENGRLFRDNFKSARIDTDEFLSVCRSQGYFDLSQLHTVIMEPSGRLSILPKSAYRNISPDDLSLRVSDESLQAILISDGQILKSNLKKIGRNVTWLEKELKKQNLYHAEEVFLAVYSNEQLNLFPKAKPTENLNTLK